MRTRTITALLVLVSLALGPFAAYYVPQTLDQLRASVGAQAASRAQSTANAVEKRLAWSEATVALLADTVDLPEQSLRNPEPQATLAERLGRVASAVAPKRQEIQHLTVIAPEGTALLRLSQRAGDGQLVFARNEAGAIQGAEGLFELTRKGLGISLGTETGKGEPKELIIVAPMGGTPGNPRVALLASINVDRLTGGLSDSYWIDASGTYLRRPVSSAKTGANAFTDFPGLENQLKIGSQAWWGDTTAVGWSRMELGSSGRLYTWVGEVTDLRPLLGWHRQAWMLIGGALLAALTVALLLGAWLSGQLKAFGQRVTEGMQQVLKGNERTPFEPVGSKEMRVFTEALNGMAETFAESQTSRALAARKLSDDHRELQRQLDQARSDQAHSQSLMESLAQPAYAVDKSGQCTYCNPACLGLLGLDSAEGLRGENIQDLMLRRAVANSEQPKAADGVAAAIRECKPQHVPSEVIWRQDGKRRLVEYWASPLTEGDEVTGAVVTLEDITERQDQAEEMQRMRTRAERTLESISDGVLTLDPKGVVDYLNPAGEAILGWTVEEAHGQPFNAVFRATEQNGVALGPDALESGLEDGPVAQELLIQTRHGASVYLECSTAPVIGTGLPPGGAIVVFRDVTGAPRMTHSSQYVAKHDLTTGLINRQEFENRLSQALSTEHARQRAICYLDLDRFRTINDACGSVAGDALLRQLASLLRASVRQRDLVGRLGDDEFGILLEHCPPDQALRIASLLRQAVEDFSFSWDDKAYSITASIGVVEIGANASDARDVIGSAEGACFAAKEQGRNRVRAFHADDDELTRYGPTHWVTRLNEALEDNGFRLFYQAVVPLSRAPGAQRDRHYELLLRMKDPTGKLANAATFLPFAERYNMIQLMDRWVVRSAFEWLSTRPKDAGDVLIEVKVSEASVADATFAEYVQTQLEKLRIPARWICFQIGASAVVSRPANATQLVRTLRGLGFKISLDDLGGGLLSVVQIRNLEVDFLRIDASHTSRVVEDELDRTLVKAMIEIARISNRRTIAKMVEQDEALTVLRDLGVDCAQGFAISKPRPLEFLKKDG